MRNISLKATRPVNNVIPTCFQATYSSISSAPSLKSGIFYDFISPAFIPYYKSCVINYCFEHTCNDDSGIGLGTCEASRFDSNSNQPSDSIRSESDWPIRKFSNRIGRACFFARRKLSQTTQTIKGA